MIEKSEVLVIGAGPGGLTAAYLLAKKGVPVTVLEADPTYVGGIARTVSYKGFHFDIGGHRFFSKSKEIEDLWTEILPSDFILRPRLSRIYYRTKFFSYPIKPFEALLKLGAFESMLCLASYAKARLRPIQDPRNFEEWVSNQFGSRLFNTFFKTYTEKVWGIPCKEISADWAAQRIKGLSLSSAIRHAVRIGRKPPSKKEVIKTLIDEFRYPRKGPGMMWEACASKMEALGGRLLRGRKVTACRWNAEQTRWTVHSKTAQGQTHMFEAQHLISSAPLRDLVLGISPVSADAVTAAETLRYRDFLVVALIVRDTNRFADNWIYIHDPSVKVGRIQNFKSWSPDMVPDPAFNCYGLEYFCFEGDGLWSLSDEALIEKGREELCRIGLIAEAEIVDGCVVRQKKAYPVYDEHYQTHVEIVRRELEERFPTLHMIGRNGMHKYNNQDHAMMTAIFSVKNIIAGKRIYDPWQVNQDAEYIEGKPVEERSLKTSLRQVPSRIDTGKK